ncbi:MAG: hypothetical protein WBG42_15255, partial [Cryomorphaceae bacterium]
MDATNKSIPTFPNWTDVLNGLFNTDTFQAAGLDRKSLDHFSEQLKSLEKKYVFPLSEPDMTVQSLESSSHRKLSLSELSEKDVLKQYDKQITESNQFTLIGDAQTMNFVRVNPKVIKLLDIPAEDEFSLARICGLDDRYELYHPEDVIHIIRLGLVALLTASIKGMEFNPFSDYYEVEFRIGYESPDRFKTVKRNCKLSNKAKDEIGTRHFDVWTIESGHDEFVCVNATFNILNNETLRACAKVLFYITNCIVLDITPRDAIFANYLNKYGYKYAREKLNESCRSFTALSSDPFDSKTASNIKSNLIKKIDTRIVENTKTPNFKA